MPSRTELKEQWQQRLQSWRTSGLSQKAWCEQHNIRQPQFWYWRKKLEEVPAAKQHKEKLPSSFVPVVLETQAEAFNEKKRLLSVSLPNGLTVSGIDSHNLTLVGQLIELLR